MAIQAQLFRAKLKENQQLKCEHVFIINISVSVRHYIWHNAFRLRFTFKYSCYSIITAKASFFKSAFTKKSSYRYGQYMVTRLWF